MFGSFWQEGRKREEGEEENTGAAETRGEEGGSEAALSRGQKSLLSIPHGVFGGPITAMQNRAASGAPLGFVTCVILIRCH